jgi:hypothetical protein
VSDYLELAKKTIEQTPVATWDAKWASELCRAALGRANASYARLYEEQRATVDFSGEVEWIEQMNAAARANDPAGFKIAVKGWERVLVGAVEKARTRPGRA